jgi:Fe-S cluster biogenesis protein NfuA
MRQQIEKSLEKIRPILQRDGGDVEFVGVNEDGVVSLRLKGACGSCPGATYTMKMVIEKELMQDIPQIKEVMQVQ